MPKIRVLVVDDSVVMRRLISEVLNTDPNFEVVGVAQNGRIALQKLSQVNPDIITMDVEMPEMDGIQTVRELRRTHPKVPVIMLSSLTQRGASATLEALAAGATDYVTKPMDVLDLEQGMAKLKEDLLPRARIYFSRVAPPTVAPRVAVRTSGTAKSPASRFDLLCIGSSTGGPQALETLFQGLTQPLPVPVVLVQHMPPMFTRMMAERLNALRIPTRTQEATHGMQLKPGNAYVAPGGFHLAVSRESTGVFFAHINSEPPENSCRPAVDLMFRTAAQTGASILGVVLTGMGQDGMRGCEFIREGGGHIVVQDQATSVVWGMPGAVAQAGLAHSIHALNDIAPELLRCLAASRR